MSGFFSNAEVQAGPATREGLVAKCGACGLYRTCSTPKMPVHGEGARRILIVGSSPDQQDDEMGFPFVGRAGQYLRDVLEGLGIDLDQDCWSTNALICYPGRNRDQEAKQIEHCRPNLLRTLATLQPCVVVLLGKQAVSALLPMHWRGALGELERWAGWTIPGPDHWICPTYHPTFLLGVDNSQLHRAFKEHIEAAVALKGKPERDETNFRTAIELLYEPDEINQGLSYFVDREWVAVDYETNCLKPEYEGAYIASCAVSDGDVTISFPWSREIVKAMGRLFQSPAQKIASNLKFEERWTRKFFGHGVSNWGWDTMLAAHCLDNRPGICSLKFQSWVKLGVPTYNEHIAPLLSSGDGHLNRVHQIPINDLLFYGGMDALLEYRLAMLQRKEMGL